MRDDPGEIILLCIIVTAKVIIIANIRNDFCDLVRSPMRKQSGFK